MLSYITSVAKSSEYFRTNKGTEAIIFGNLSNFTIICDTYTFSKNQILMPCIEYEWFTTEINNVFLGILLDPPLAGIMQTERMLDIITR